jgi:hypothetical protein
MLYRFGGYYAGHSHTIFVDAFFLPISIARRIWFKVPNLRGIVGPKTLRAAPVPKNGDRVGRARCLAEGKPKWPEWGLGWSRYLGWLVVWYWNSETGSEQIPKKANPPSMPDASSRPGQDDLLQILLKKQMMETVAERTMHDTRRGDYVANVESPGLVRQITLLKLA